MSEEELAAAFAAEELARERVKNSPLNKFKNIHKFNIY